MSRPRRSIRLPLPRPREVVLTATVAALTVVPVLRTWALQWGATEAELDATLPGDDVVPAADHVSTRAVSINVPADRVWPWVVQIGQGRGGFYSYDVLENLIGCDIHSANRIEERWQDLAVGDEIRLHPQADALTVSEVDPGRALVLRGSPRPDAFSFSWAFVLRPAPDGGTRLLVRERYGCPTQAARLLIEPVSFASFVMSQAMLRGIKERAERPA